jgi:hypothetical protein
MKFSEELMGPGGFEQFFVDQIVGKLTPEKRRFIAAALVEWLTHTARKKAVPDLLRLIDDFGKRIGRMCEDIEIQIVDRKPVVMAVGSGRDTLRALEQGTNWFDPCDDVVMVMISSLWKS